MGGFVPAAPAARALFLYRGLQACGLGELWGRVCARANFDPGLTEDPHARISLEQLDLLYELAAELSGDPEFGLRAGLATSPRKHGALGYSLLVSDTLLDGLKGLERCVRALAPDEDMSLHADEHETHLVYRSRAPERARQRCEFMIATLVHAARTALQRPVAPIQVQLAHAAPASSARHRELLACPVRFAAPDCRVVFDSAVLSCPLPGAEPDLHRILREHVRQQAERWPQQGLLSPRVRALVSRGLPRGTASCGAISRALGVSERTLQRRLRDEGTSLKEIIDDARRDLACSRLRNRAPIQEVALALGYRSTAAFYAAFSRWTGQTPAEYRRG